MQNLDNDQYDELWGDAFDGCDDLAEQMGTPPTRRRASGEVSAAGRVPCAGSVGTCCELLHRCLAPGGVFG